MALSRPLLMANFIGIAGLLISIGYVANSFVATDTTPKCESRYSGATEFSLVNERGVPLSPIELQARAGLDEWGVLSNAKVVELESGPASHAIQVSLEKGTGSGFVDNVPRGGIGFRWTPLEMGKSEAACLYYNAWIPQDFEFSGAGGLPGLVAGANFNPRADAVKGNGFAARIAWNHDGKFGISAQVAGDDGWQNLPVARGVVEVPRGRWVSIEQEMVLNSPGKADGYTRLWIDGKIEFDKKGLSLRTDPNEMMSGVMFDVFYGSVFNSAIAPKSTSILLSPLSIRWK